MKANELMIGNIVEIDGEPRVIRQVHRRKVGHSALGRPEHSYAKISDIKPILITEELLVRNGFKALDKRILELKRVKTCTDLYFIYDEQHLPEHWRLIIRNEQVTDLSVSYITHLHQLQNLLNIMDIKLDFEV